MNLNFSQHSTEYKRTQRTQREMRRFERVDEVEERHGPLLIRRVQANAFGESRYRVERYGSKMHDGLFETLAGARALFRRLGGVV